MPTESLPDDGPPYPAENPSLDGFDNDVLAATERLRVDEASYAAKAAELRARVDAGEIGQDDAVTELSEWDKARRIPPTAAPGANVSPAEAPGDLRGVEGVTSAPTAHRDNVPMDPASKATAADRDAGQPGTGKALQLRQPSFDSGSDARDLLIKLAEFGDKGYTIKPDTATAGGQAVEALLEMNSGDDSASASDNVHDVYPMPPDNHGEVVHEVKSRDRAKRQWKDAFKAAPVAERMHLAKHPDVRTVLSETEVNDAMSGFDRDEFDDRSRLIDQDIAARRRIIEAEMDERRSVIEAEADERLRRLEAQERARRERLGY